MLGKYKKNTTVPSHLYWKREEKTCLAFNFRYHWWLVLEGDVNCSRVNNMGNLMANRVRGSWCIPRRSNLFSIFRQNQLCEVGRIDGFIITTVTTIAFISNICPRLDLQDRTIDSNIHVLSLCICRSNVPSVAGSLCHVAKDLISNIAFSFRTHHDIPSQSNVPGPHWPIVALLARVLQDWLDDVKDLWFRIYFGNPIYIL